MKTEENMISDWLEINGDPQIEIKVLNELVDKLIQEKDNFAIGFAEWTSYKYKYLETKGWFGNSYELEMGIFKTSKELLEIYKKEKRL